MAHEEKGNIQAVAVKRKRLHSVLFGHPRDAPVFILSSWHDIERSFLASWMHRIVQGQSGSDVYSEASD